MRPIQSVETNQPTNKQTLSENIWWVCILNIHHLQLAESNYLTKAGTDWCTVAILTHVGWNFCESFSLIMRMRFLQITSLFLSCIEKPGHRHYSVAHSEAEVIVMSFWSDFFCCCLNFERSLFCYCEVVVLFLGVTQRQTGQLGKKCQIYFWLL